MADSPIRWDFSLGNLINLVAMGIAVAVAWGTMAERSDVTHKGIQELEANQAQTETRIRQLETSQARADERLTSILQIVSRIESRLEREGRR
jgi:Arc/MetJ-type ribon-helix-helix transcriptional regulator